MNNCYPFKVCLLKSITINSIFRWNGKYYRKDFISPRLSCYISPLDEKDDDVCEIPLTTIIAIVRP